MTTRKLATKYIEEQIRIIEKHGGEPRLDPGRRLEAIESTKRVFDTMRAGASAPAEHRSPGVRRGLRKLRR